MSMRGRWIAPPVGSFLNASSCTRMQSSMVSSCETSSLLMMSMSRFPSRVPARLSPRPAPAQRIGPAGAASRRCVTDATAPLTARHAPDSRRCPGRTTMPRTQRCSSAILAMRPLLAGRFGPEQAQRRTVEQFYKGKTINFLVASVPGGVNDLTARLISPPSRQPHPGQSQYHRAEPAVVRAGRWPTGSTTRRRRTASRSRSSSAARRRSPSWATPTRASTRSRSPGSAACRPMATTPIRSRSIRASTPRPWTTCARPTGRRPRSARPASAPPTASSPTSPRTCSG